jgi:hypothetical protein
MGEDASNTIELVMGEAKTGRFQQSLLSRYRWCPFSIIGRMNETEEGSKDGMNR